MLLVRVIRSTTQLLFVRCLSYAPRNLPVTRPRPHADKPGGDRYVTDPYDLVSKPTSRGPNSSENRTANGPGKAGRPHRAHDSPLCVAMTAKRTKAQRFRKVCTKGQLIRTQSQPIREASRLPGGAREPRKEPCPPGSSLTSWTLSLSLFTGTCSTNMDTTMAHVFSQLCHTPNTATPGRWAVSEPWSSSCLGHFAVSRRDSHAHPGACCKGSRGTSPCATTLPRHPRRGPTPTFTRERASAPPCAVPLPASSLLPTGFLRRSCLGRSMLIVYVT